MIYKFNPITIKNPIGFNEEINTLVLKFTWKYKGPRRAKTVLKKKKKVEGFKLSDFTTYNNVTIIRTVCTGVMIDI